MDADPSNSPLGTYTSLEPDSWLMPSGSLPRDNQSRGIFPLFKTTPQEFSPGTQFLINVVFRYTLFIVK